MDHRLDNGSCVSGDVHAQFCEQRWGRFPALTLLIVLTKNQKRLENVVAMARAEMNVLKVEPHPKKTFVGKAVRGFSFLGFDFMVEIKPPKKAGDRPIRQVTQRVRTSTLRRCYLRSFLLYKNADSRARIESYWTKFLQWADSGTREGTIWLYKGERCGSSFLVLLLSSIYFL